MLNNIEILIGIITSKRNEFNSLKIFYFDSNSINLIQISNNKYNQQIDFNNINIINW
jgi:hypothetical protein